LVDEENRQEGFGGATALGRLEFEGLSEFELPAPAPALTAIALSFGGAGDGIGGGLTPSTT